MAKKPTILVPEGIKAFTPEWKPFLLDSKKTLIINDLHVRYHDREAVELALETGYKQGVDCVLINGDLNDFYSISRWEKDPTKRDFGEEVETTQYILQSIRLGFGKVRIILKCGNHEDRYKKKIMDKLPELLNVPYFNYESVIGAERYGVEVITEKIPVKIGKLNVIHGHELRGYGTVNPARSLYLKTKTHTLSGHYHRTSEHIERDLDDEVVGCWSTGCLCDLHPDWMPVNNWNHGFAIVDLLDEESGEYSVRNYKIIEGKLF
jgi:hypothetical protein